MTRFRAGLLLGLVALLCACEAPDAMDGEGDAQQVQVSNSNASGFWTSLFGGGTRDVVLAGGAVALTTPHGWCVDTASVQNTTDASFALVAGCREVTRQRRFSPSSRGYATLVVGPYQPEGVNVRRLLGDVVGKNAEALASEADGLMLARATRSGDGAPVWWGARDLGGWPVLITVRDVDGALQDAGGAQIVRALSNELRAGQSARAAPEQRNGAPRMRP